MANTRFDKGINPGQLTSDPANPKPGDMYYNTSTGKHKQYINGAWREVVSADDNQTLSNKTFSNLSQTVADDSTSTGTQETLQAFTTGIVRLTNASLDSISGIPAGTSGQQVTVENKTGSSLFILNDDNGASTNDRILTGTGGQITMQNDAIFVFTYDSTSNRWGITGGSGGGLAVGTINSETASANGAVITNAGSLVMQSASATVPGLVDNTTQSFSGNKTFTGTIGASNFSGSSSGTNTGDVTLATVGSSPANEGASLSGQVLTLQPADGTHAGVVSTTTQTFAGNKTFTGTVSASNISGTQSGTNTGDVTLSAFGSSPNSNGASLSGQALTLQPADATNPGGVSTGSQSFAGVKTFGSNPIMSGLTASQAVVTDGSKALASLAYASANTASALVQRDGSGNFSAGTVTASVTGTASGNTTIATQTNHGVVVASSTNAMTSTAAGTSGQPLLSGGASADPAYGTLGISFGGTGQTSASNAFNALAPATATGGLIVGSGTNTYTNLAVGSANQVLGITGSGTTPAYRSINERAFPNYISANPNFEIDTTGWSTYADAADVVPVDATGGSPNSTFTRSTSSPLRGTASAVLSKGAANRQGEGVSYAFTIDSADKGKVLQGSFEYAISSGTYTDDDVRVFIYDVTNAALIYPQPYLLKNHTLAAEKFGFEFQSSSSSTSYRLVIHIASTNATAYDLKFDNFSVGVNAKLYGSPVTDWVAYTPTLSTGARSGSPTYDRSFWRRVGSDMEIVWDYKHTSAGTTGSGNYNFTIPSGYTIDTTKVGSGAGTGGGGTAVGTFNHTYDSNQGSGVCIIASSTQLAAYTDLDANSSAVMWSSGGTGVFGATNLTFSIRAKIPITGWQSQVIMSNDASTRIVAARYYRSTTQSISDSTDTIVDFATKVYDTHNAVTTGSSWKFTAPVSGYYRIGASAHFTTNATGGRTMLIYKNNSIYSYVQSVPVNSASNGTILHGEDTVSMIAGDYIDVRVNQNSTGSLNLDPSSGSTLIHCQVEQIQGPSQVAASEVYAPTVQKLTSGTSQTYTLPTNPKRPLYIRVRAIGAGGGGGGSHNGTPGAVSAGGTGGNTTFGTSLLTANGGVGGSKDASGVSTGGTATINSPAYGTAVTGGNGFVCGVGATATLGGQGAASPWSNGAAGGANTAGTNATANTGSGGGGGGNPGTAGSVYGGGGAAGGYIDAIIPNPSATYTYSIGTAGTAGTAGTGGFAGGTGGSGYIEVTEYYQ